MLFKKFVALAAFVALTGQAQAAPILLDQVGESVAVSFSQGSLAANITYLLTTFNTATEQATFSVTVQNTSTVASKIGSFGIGFITPSLLSIVDNTTIYDPYVADTIASTNIAWCEATGSSCTNGNNAGVANGGSLTFSSTLTFGDLTSAGLTFDDPYRISFIQGTGANTATTSFNGTATFREAPETPQSVPEPGTLVLVGAALALTGLVRRRRPAVV